MADAIGPRVPPRPGGLYGADRRRTQGQIRQLQRPRVKLPRAARAASGGGIVGMAQVDSSGALYDAGAAGYLDYSSVSYSDPFDPNTAAPGLPPSTWCSVSGYQLTLDEGWYDITVLVDLAWPGGTMTWFRPQIIAGFDMPHQNPPVLPAVDYSSRRGLSQILNFGPTYVNAGDPVWFEVRYGPGAGPGGALDGLQDGPGSPWISWAIAKYG